MNQHTASPDRLLLLPIVLHMTGLVRSSLYKAIGAAPSDGGFPRPVKLGRASAWSESEVRDWIEQRKADRQVA